MKYKIEKFDFANVAPDVVVGYDIWNKKFVFRIRNNAKIENNFENFIEANSDKIIMASYLGAFNLHQSHIEEWQKYLLNNITDEWSKSPYSNSYYNSKSISWSKKPEGSLRLSDHWNFCSEGENHCATTNPKFQEGWAVAKYEKGIYHILRKF